MLIINNNIRHDPFALPNMGRLEAVAACIYFHNNEQLLFVSTYLPPPEPIIRTDLDKIFSTSTTVVLVGDLNSKHVAWNSSSVDPTGKTLLAYCIDNNLSIHYPNQPTHFPYNSTPSVLDIALTKLCSVSKPLAAPVLSSDHNPIVFKLHLRPTVSSPRRMYDYKHANWQLFQFTLNNSLSPNTILRSIVDLEEAAIAFEAAIRQASTTAIPLHSVIRNRLILSPSLTYLLKQKNYYRRRYRRLRTPTFRYLYHLVTQLFLTKLQQLKNTKWNSFLRNLHPEKLSFWKITRYFTTSKLTIPQLLRNGIQIYGSSEKAEELTRQFERFHNLTLHMSTPHHSQVTTRSANKAFCFPTPSTTTIQPTDPSEVRRHILSLKPRTAPGNDGI
jgi:hypothetical protein